MNVLPLITHKSKCLRKTPFATFKKLKFCLVIAPSLQMEVQLFEFEQYKITGLLFFEEALSGYTFHKLLQCTLIRYNSVRAGKIIASKSTNLCTIANFYTC